MGPKKIIVILFVLSLSLSTMLQAVYATGDTGNKFKDVDKSHWAYNAINAMNEKNIISGYPDNTFKPDNSVTRAEFAKIMVLALNLNKKLPQSPSFIDISYSDWAYPYVETAKYYLTGFRTSSGDYFRPSSPAVREDMAVALVKAMGYADEDYDISMLDTFSDKSDISPNLNKYISIAATKSIMKGYPENNGKKSFKPKNNITRAEAAVLLYTALGEEKVTYDTDEKITYPKDTKDEDKESSYLTDEYQVPELTASVSNNKINLKWKPIYDDRLQYYKVVISKYSESPKYPENGWLYYITEKEKSYATVDNSTAYNGGDFGEYLNPGEEYYFSITAVYNDTKIPGNVLKLIYPKSSSNEFKSNNEKIAPVVNGQVYGDKVVLNWDKITSNNFQGYKVVISKSNPNPKYPEDGYMFWITDRNQTQAVISKENGYNNGDFGSHLVSGENYYFSITAVYNDSKIPGNVLELTFP